MRKSRLTVLGVVLIVAFAALGAFNMTNTPRANADGGIHVKGQGAVPDACAMCHRVHRGANDTLNTQSDIQQLCLSCHDTGAVNADNAVTIGTNEGTGGALRAGGFNYARIDTTDPSLAATPGATPQIGVLAAVDAQSVKSSHSVDGSPQTIWGNGPINATPVPGKTGYELTCTSCHDPHGNGNFRILVPRPGGVPTQTPAVNIADRPPYPTPKVYTTTNYFDMTFTGSVLTDSILIDTSAWCAQCHTRYLAARRAPLDANASRVNSGDAIFTYRHTSAGYQYASTATPSGPLSGPTPVTRACITCHAVHGSNASAGAYSGAVPNPDNIVPLATAQPGNNKLLKMNNRGICQKCHNK